MLNKNLKLMTSKDAEEWFLHFINQKMRDNINTKDNVLMLSMQDINKALTSVGYKNNLIDDNIVNEVLSQNNFMYKKVDNYYAIIDCMTNQFPHEILNKTIEHGMNKDCIVLKKLKKYQYYLIKVVEKMP